MVVWPIVWVSGGEKLEAQDFSILDGLHCVLSHAENITQSHFLRSDAVFRFFCSFSLDRWCVGRAVVTLHTPKDFIGSKLNYSRQQKVCGCDAIACAFAIVDSSIIAFAAIRWYAARVVSKALARRLLASLYFSGFRGFGFHTAPIRFNGHTNTHIPQLLFRISVGARLPLLAFFLYSLFRVCCLK